MDNQGPLDLKIFHELGMIRKKCPSCGNYFWTSDKKREKCGDPPCGTYTFIGKPPTKVHLNVKEMRDLFINFFRKDHHFVEPYPVVPRWREDVLLVNASIYDFQPHVTSGVVKPPGNPLVMSQPCIRMNDVDKVGVTGRHLTSFEMLCHDSFNYEKQLVYWNNETVTLCNRFLNEKMGVSQDDIVYKEKPWAGGGNAGNALEVFVSGLEVATLVFMDLVENENGSVEIDGIKYGNMPLKVVDTGYGLERLAWLSLGTPTIFEAIYPEVMKLIRENSTGVFPDYGILSKILDRSLSDDDFNEHRIIGEIADNSDSGLDISRLEEQFEYAKSCYILADHSRSLLFMFSDYVIPSNVKVGYLERLLIRRSLRSAASIGLSISLFELIDAQYRNYSDILHNYPVDFIKEMISRESEKMDSLLKAGTAQIERLIKKQDQITGDDLIKLYDSSGLLPEFVSSRYAEITGKALRVPDNFHELVVAIHEKRRSQKEVVSSYPEIFTRPLYYDDTSIKEFSAIVLYSAENAVILNQTAFYPEGGGQPTDLGYLIYNGRKIDVTKVEKIGKTIVHRINGSIPEHSRVRGFIDYERRRQLMIHHSATHLLLGVTREILGDHVWQNSVQKGIETSRLDVTHYEKISQEQIKKIEMRCLQIITENHSIKVRNMDWNKAISQYGFRLFQGGVPLDSKLRVVEIEGVDVEGCGGTHLSSTYEIGFLKIVSTETVQEGIQRLTFSAGPAALIYTEKIGDVAYRLQEFLSSSLEELDSRLNVFISNSMDAFKYRERSSKIIAELAVEHSKEIFRKGETAVMFSTIPLGKEEINIVIPMILRKKESIILVTRRSDAGINGFSIISNRFDLSNFGTGKEDLLITTKKNSRIVDGTSQRNVDENLIKTLFN